MSDSPAPLQFLPGVAMREFDPGSSRDVDQEGGAVDRPENALATCTDSRSPRNVAEQGDLAEPVAWAEQSLSRRPPTKTSSVPLGTR